MITLEKTLIHNSNNKKYSNALDWIGNDSLRYIDHGQMLTFDTNEHKLIQRYPLPKFVQPQYISHKSPTDMYFTTRNFFRLEMKQIDDFNKPDKILTLFESKQNSPYVQYDNVHQNYYFVSMRSGQEQIWLGNQLGAEQLTEFKEPEEITYFEISPDGKRLLYYRGDQFEILNTRSGEIKNFNELGDARMTKMIWGPDSNSLIYFDKSENYQVKKYDFATQQHSIVATLKAINLFSSNKGVPFAVTEQGIVDLTTEKVYPLPENFNTSAQPALTQVGKYFYAIEGLGSNIIYRWQKDQQTADTIDTQSYIVNMQVTDKSEILLITRKRLNTKIERLTWKPLESSN